MPLRSYRRRRVYPRRKRPFRRNNRRRGKYRKMGRPSKMVVRSPGVIAADRMFVKLVYNDWTNNTLFSALTNVNGYRYRWNSAFDVDPLLGGTIIPGFTELAALYGAYRVRACSITVDFVNKENYAITVGIIPLTVDPGPGITLAVAHGFVANPYCRTFVLAGLNGQNRVRLKNYISTWKLVGDVSAKSDVTYASSTGMNPTTQLYFCVFAYTTDQTIWTAGVTFNARLKLYTEMYNRRELSTS